jgi:hypothetical protein
VDFIDEPREGGAELGWELGGEVFLEGSDADELDDVGDVLGATCLFEADDELATDEVGEANDANTLDGAKPLGGPPSASSGTMCPATPSKMCSRRSAFHTMPAASSFVCVSQKFEL